MQRVALRSAAAPLAALGLAALAACVQQPPPVIQTPSGYNPAWRR